MLDILNDLNPRQREAVEQLEGPVLIMAGAGSGKTKALTYRLANLLAHGVPGWAVLAVTFTNKAAREMRSRVDKLIGSAAGGVWLSTFHSFCATVLRRECAALEDYSSNFVIYDENDSKVVVKRVLASLDLSENDYSVQGMKAYISGNKNELVDPENAMAIAEEAHSVRERTKARVFAAYNAELVKNNAMDFDDLLVVAVQLLERNPEVRERYQTRFRYILVDEYQDTNAAQYELTRLLAARHHNLCVVGDADQSIYGWRGADINNILNFEKDYPEARVFYLEQNYRSTQKILALANAVIEHNRQRKPKRLWTRNAAGEPVTLFIAESERDEAQFLAQQIEQRLRRNDNAQYDDFAVLYRMNAQSRVIEEEFVRRGVPYVIVGGLKFYDRKEIKDALAYLRLVANSADTVSLRRIVNEPRRSLGATTLAHLEQFADGIGRPMFEVMADAEQLRQAPGLTTRARNACAHFAQLIAEARQTQRDHTLPELLDWLLEQSGYRQMLREDPRPETESRLENLQELVGVAQSFAEENPGADVESFLNHVALISSAADSDFADDRVTLMTYHAAKGLEFPVVFMVGLEEGLFPNSRALAEANAIEEERRVCYVGLTRAQRKLYLSYARRHTLYNRTMYPQPSRFLGEMPAEFVEVREQRRSSYGEAEFRPLPLQRRQAAASVVRPDMTVRWKVGDRVRHGKWGVGDIVAVRGSGDETELRIFFPDLGATKSLMQKYAPILPAK